MPISEALAALDLDISAARISTEKGAAIDSFYVRESFGAKVVGGARQQEIDRALRQALIQLEKRA